MSYSQEDLLMRSNYMLQEICHASSMRSATALSKMLKTPLKVEVKPVEITSIQKMTLPGGAQNKLVSLYMPINGAIVNGGSSLILSQNSALAMCDVLLNRKAGSTTKLNELEESALKEMANIILGNFLAPFSQSLLTSTMMHNNADFYSDTANSVLNQTRELLSRSIKNDSVLNIAFTYESAKLKGNMNIVFESDTINSLLNTVMVISNG